MKICEYIASPRVSLATLLIALPLLGGCDGGLIGTGTGPYKLENLPDRISPDIPKTILKGNELTPLEPKIQEQTESTEQIERISPQSKNVDTDRSVAWTELQEELNSIAFMRLQAQSNATIIDLAFNDIVNKCSEQLLDCIIPENLVSVTMTEAVVLRLTNLYTNWASSVSHPEDYVEEGEKLVNMLEKSLTSLLGKKIMFGETRYSQLDGAPYSHSVKTSLKRENTQDNLFATLLWMDQDFYARWHNDGSVAKFETHSSNRPYQEYFYQKSTPSELVITALAPENSEQRGGVYARLIGNDPNMDGILLEMASLSEFSVASGDDLASENALASEQIPSAGSGSGGDAYTYVLGQMNNSGGYLSYEQQFIDPSAANQILSFDGYRESFDRIGKLVAGEQCSVLENNSGALNCGSENYTSSGPEGISVTDSAYFFQNEDFDALAALHDAIRWKIKDLPVEKAVVAVVSADSAIELSERELLCRGYQIIPNSTPVFCSATDEQLDNTVVVELLSGKPGTLIPEARLIPVM